MRRGDPLGRQIFFDRGDGEPWRGHGQLQLRIFTVRRAQLAGNGELQVFGAKIDARQLPLLRLPAARQAGLPTDVQVKPAIANVERRRKKFWRADRQLLERNFALRLESLFWVSFQMKPPVQSPTQRVYRQAAPGI